MNAIDSCGRASRRPRRGLVLIWLLLATFPGIGAASLAPGRLAIGGGEIEVTFAPGPLAVTRQQALDWVATAARAVTHYYGRFPVAHLDLRIVPRRHGITGTTYGGSTGSAMTRILLGADTDGADLEHDWVMTHEMVHLAFPLMREEHHWIEEGLATYIEPIARAQIGTLAASEVWRQLVQGLPKGLPRTDDRGLDRTPTWGRTYWGGALFCLRADLEIREATNNRYGLRDALRGLLAAGGNIETHWPIGRALEVADRAVGVHVLETLYARMRDAPDPIDLDALWRRLGVVPVGHSVRFDDSTPLAAIRRRITAP
ncbi:MAG: hypothetical protein WB784_12180 [Rhodanobacteraceae bacterium]